MIAAYPMLYYSGYPLIAEGTFLYTMVPYRPAGSTFSYMMVPYRIAGINVCFQTLILSIAAYPVLYSSGYPLIAEGTFS